MPEIFPLVRLSTFMGWSLNVVSRSTITQLLRAGRSATSSPTPKVTLHGWIVIERRRRARLRRRLLLTPWQRGLVKRMFHGKKISPSLIIPDCILPRSQREREKHEERNGNTEAEGSRGEGECREEGWREQSFSVEASKTSLGSLSGSEVFDVFLKTQSFYLLWFPN